MATVRVKCNVPTVVENNLGKMILVNDCDCAYIVPIGQFTLPTKLDATFATGSIDVQHTENAFVVRTATGVSIIDASGCEQLDGADVRIHCLDNYVVATDRNYIRKDDDATNLYIDDDRPLSDYAAMYASGNSLMCRTKAGDYVQLMCTGAQVHRADCTRIRIDSSHVAYENLREKGAPSPPVYELRFTKVMDVIPLKNEYFIFVTTDHTIFLFHRDLVHDTPNPYIAMFCCHLTALLNRFASSHTNSFPIKTFSNKSQCIVQTNDRRIYVFSWPKVQNDQYDGCYPVIDGYMTNVAMINKGIDDGLNQHSTRLVGITSIREGVHIVKYDGDVRWYVLDLRDNLYVGIVPGTDARNVQFTMPVEDWGRRSDLSLNGVYPTLFDDAVGSVSSVDRLGEGFVVQYSDGTCIYRNVSVPVRNDVSSESPLELSTCVNWVYSSNRLRSVQNPFLQTLLGEYFNANQSVRQAHAQLSRWHANDRSSDECASKLPSQIASFASRHNYTYDQVHQLIVRVVNKQITPDQFTRLVNKPAATSCIPSMPPLASPLLPQVTHRRLFPAQTPIQTDQGTILVADLVQHFHTINQTKIVAVICTPTPRNATLVSFRKNALRKRVPSQTTIVGPNCRIYHRGAFKKASYFIKRYCGVTKVKTGDDSPRESWMYQVVLDRHVAPNNRRMLINGMFCRSLVTSSRGNDGYHRVL